MTVNKIGLNDPGGGGASTKGKIGLQACKKVELKRYFGLV